MSLSEFVAELIALVGNGTALNDKKRFQKEPVGLLVFAMSC
jgi:hypothetical protein